MLFRNWKTPWLAKSIIHIVRCITTCSNYHYYLMRITEQINIRRRQYAVSSISICNILSNLLLYRMIPYYLTLKLQNYESLYLIKLLKNHGNISIEIWPRFGITKNAIPAVYYSYSFIMFTPAVGNVTLVVFPIKDLSHVIAIGEYTISTFKEI